MPVSFPFFTPSVFVGARQMPPLQTPLVQSAVILHFLGSSPLGRSPPQSRSVSLPFFRPSLQLAAAHTPVAWLQTPDGQSAAFMHFGCGTLVSGTDASFFGGVAPSGSGPC